MMAHQTTPVATQADTSLQRPWKARWSQIAVNAAAVFTLSAAIIHFFVVPEHFQEYLLYGLFFIAAGIAQAGLALALVIVPSRRLYIAGLAGSLGMVALWMISRTVGLPFGPNGAWRPEMVGMPDIIASLLELVAALFFLRLIVRRSQQRAFPPGRVVLATVPLVLLATLLTYLGADAGSHDMPVAFNAAPAVAGHPSTSVTQLTEAADAHGPIKTFTLAAQAARIGGHEAWTYNGTVPGPELRVTQGDRVRVTLVNHLPVSTTIHWHGIRVPNADDGVAGITQNAVAPGASYTYSFVAEDAGTYWYHSHQDTMNQIDQGLYGTLIVEPSGGHVPEAHDYTVLLHTTPGGSSIAVNGSTTGLHLAARPGEEVRLRLINAVPPSMNGGPEAPVLLGAPYRVVALDGHDLNQPQMLGPERLPLGIGQRADVVFTMPASGAVRLVDTELQGQPSPIERFFTPPLPLKDVVTIGDGPVAATNDLSHLPIFDLTHYGVPTTDPVATAQFAATYPVVLATTPGFHDGRIELVHTINGQASPNVPPITVREGQVVRLHIVNETGEYHPMHLHGHIFSVLARNGQPIVGSPIHLDSILVGPHSTWDVAFLADNPGIWMFHCHVLLHASFGMSMTVNYVGITTPFEMGSRSGNVPE
ncbi:MAG TPA: multicopper oxidase family protein [Ktedonobacterales bacterium]